MHERDLADNQMRLIPVTEGKRSVWNSVLLLCLCIFVFVPGVSQGQDLKRYLKEETLAYFQPLKGKVLSVTGDAAVTDLGAASGARKGMRLVVFREGVPFLHPVTKEPIGKIETPVGRTEVRETGAGSSVLHIMSGEAKEGDLVRISETKVRILFYQDRSVDWDLAESYHQLLKESGRFDLLDTALDSADDETIRAEAKRLSADVALILTARESERDVLLKQRLLWVDDGLPLASSEVTLDISAVRELRLSRGTFTLPVAAGDALLTFDLPYSARLVASGDVNGDGKQEVIVSNGKDLFVYDMSTSLVNLYEIKGSGSEDHLRIETLDLDGDGRDEIVVTAMTGALDVKDVGSDSIVKSSPAGSGIVSSVYKLRGPEFSLFWKERFFARVLPGRGLIAQEYDSADGYSGPVFALEYREQTFSKGGVLKLPKGVNIYDFAFLPGQEGEGYSLAYDDAAYLNLYNKDGLRVWRSKGDYGGFPMTFKKAAPTVMAERGEWSVKDRLPFVFRGALVVKRIPLTETVRGLGHKNSQIRTLWWTGMSMEDSLLIDGIPGGVLDFALTSDRLVVLSKPLFGIKTKNILKGESPLGSMIYVYSLKGR